MQIGITGFPRSGKTTVFSALAPGVHPGREVTFGNIKVPDPRVLALAEHFKPKKTVLTEVTFVDIAGTPGASTKALSPSVINAMKNVTALVHVVRVFDDPTGARPAAPDVDVDGFDAELLLHDLEIVERRVERMRKERRSDLEAKTLERFLELLEQERPLREIDLSEDEKKAVSGYQLLSRKPLITLFNLDEAQWGDPDCARFRQGGSRGPKQITTAMAAGVEAEIAEMEPEDQAEFLDAMGLKEPARDVFIRAAYDVLDLISFLTSGPDECRAWTVRRGSTAPVAAGKIHSDLERGFIRAEVLAWADWLTYGSEADAKKAGVYRVEGKGYVVQDGDILHIRANV